MNQKRSLLKRSLSQFSEFHKRNQEALILYLVESFGYSLELSALIVDLHNCSDLPEMMNLFILDDANKYAHLFIPTKESAQGNLCQICGQSEIYHYSSLSWQEYSHWIEEDYRKLREDKVQGMQQDFSFPLLAEGQSETISKKPSLEKKYSDLSQFSEKQIRRPQLEEIQKILLPRHHDLLVQRQHLIRPELFKYLPRNFSSNSENSSDNYTHCVICYGNIRKEELAQISGVQHQVCLNCMNEYLKEEILNLRVQEIGCPHCAETLSPQTIKGFVSNAVYEKYQTFLRNIQIQRNPNLRWCPNPSCSVVLNLTKKSGNVLCPKCNTRICVKCNRIAHPKMSCDAMMRKQLEGLENAKDLQKCKKCKALVEKISGCNHMTCTVCRYEWCWLCGSTYSNFHFNPLNPLGCAGMQDSRHTGRSKCSIYLIRILIFLGILILTPIALPISMLLVGPVMSVSTFDRQWGYRYGCCCKVFTYPLIFILGFIGDPFIWIGIVVYFLPKICSAICEYFQNRKRIHENSDNYLKKRLLQDDNIVVMAE